MSNWQKINYLGDKFKPFHIRLDYCDEDVDLQDMYRFDDSEEWINRTVKEIQDGYKYWVILRARVYLAGVEVGSHSLGGLLFDNTEQMESMMKTDYEGIIEEAVSVACHNLHKMADAMNERATA
jgi:hypothetical protein